MEIKLHLEMGGEFYFKPIDNVKVTLKTVTTSGGFLRRSSSSNGTYTDLYTFPSSATTTYTSLLTSSYYYSISSANATAYIRDAYGSAVQIVQ